MWLFLSLLRCCFWNRPNCLLPLKTDGCSPLVEQDRALTYACCTKLIFAFPSLRDAWEPFRSTGREMTLALFFKGVGILQTPPSPQNRCLFYTHCWQVAVRGEIWDVCLQACAPTVLGTSQGGMTRRSIMGKNPGWNHFCVEVNSTTPTKC